MTTSCHCLSDSIDVIPMLSYEVDMIYNVTIEVTTSCHKVSDWLSYEVDMICNVTIEVTTSCHRVSDCLVISYMFES